MSTMEMAVPERSLRQRMDALRKGNAIRVERAALKREIKAGRLKVRPVVSEPPSFLASMRVFDLLLTVPTVGRVKANRIIRDLQISPAKTVGGLSPRQREALIVRLGPR